MVFFIIDILAYRILFLQFLFYSVIHCKVTTRTVQIVKL